METVYEYLIRQPTVRVDLGKKKLNCKIDPTKFSCWVDVSNPVEELERLYEEYYASLPSGKDNSKFFYALPVDELTTEQMVIGERRSEAKKKLECFVFCLCRQMDPWFKGWFWKSKQNPNLVVLKDWFN